MLTENQREALVSAANEARQSAYAPYSNYAVGAAILTEDGRIISGANVENVSYGLTICAERAAAFTAISAGVRRFLAIAVCSDNAASPCGACRQVLREFAADIPVLLCDEQGLVRETSLAVLLPDNFGPDHLL